MEAECPRGPHSGLKTLVRLGGLLVPAEDQDARAKVRVVEDGPPGATFSRGRRN